MRKLEAREIGDRGACVSFVMGGEKSCCMSMMMHGISSCASFKISWITPNSLDLFLQIQGLVLFLFLLLSTSQKLACQLGDTCTLVHMKCRTTYSTHCPCSGDRSCMPLFAFGYTLRSSQKELLLAPERKSGLIPLCVDTYLF